MIRRLMMALVLACLWSSPALMAAPIHDAARQDDEHRVKELPAAGADMNAKDDGLTSLHWAVVRGHAGATKALLAAGAKVNARTEGKLTPLDAARLGMEETEESVKPFQEVIRTLKAHGARGGRGR